MLEGGGGSVVLGAPNVYNIKLVMGPFRMGSILLREDSILRDRKVTLIIVTGGPDCRLEKNSGVVTRATAEVSINTTSFYLQLI